MEMVSPRAGELLWEPSKGIIANSNMEAFRQHISQKYNLDLKTYEQLWRWSIENIGDFWSESWSFCGIIASSPYECVTFHLLGKITVVVGCG